MVNDTACQKQEAPNQTCKPEVWKTNLLFFTKKYFIIYQSYKLKIPAVGLSLKCLTPRAYLHID